MVSCGPSLLLFNSPSRPTICTDSVEERSITLEHSKRGQRVMNISLYQTLTNKHLNLTNSGMDAHDLCDFAYSLGCLGTPWSSIYVVKQCKGLFSILWDLSMNLCAIWCNPTSRAASFCWTWTCSIWTFHPDHTVYMALQYVSYYCAVRFPFSSVGRGGEREGSDVKSRQHGCQTRHHCSKPLQMKVRYF